MQTGEGKTRVYCYTPVALPQPGSSEASAFVSWEPFTCILEAKVLLLNLGSFPCFAMGVWFLVCPGDMNVVGNKPSQ